MLLALCRTPPHVHLMAQLLLAHVTGWTDPRGTQQQQQPQQPSPSPPPSQLSAEAHAGFAHVATMLTQQGIEDPLGEPHLARTLVQFFEGRMVRAVAVSPRNILWRHLCVCCVLPLPRVLCR